jgi:hypothetical protein
MGPDNPPHTLVLVNCFFMPWLALSLCGNAKAGKQAITKKINNDRKLPSAAQRTICFIGWG